MNIVFDLRHTIFSELTKLFNGVTYSEHKKNKKRLVNDMEIMNDLLGMTSVFVCKLNLLVRYSPGATEENYNYSQRIIQSVKFPASYVSNNRMYYFW
jgi:hypothetical protein